MKSKIFKSGLVVLVIAAVALALSGGTTTKSKPRKVRGFPTK